MYLLQFYETTPYQPVNVGVFGTEVQVQGVQPIAQYTTEV